MTSDSAETAGFPVIKGRVLKNKLSWICCYTIRGYACHTSARDVGGFSSYFF